MLNLQLILILGLTFSSLVKAKTLSKIEFQIEGKLPKLIFNQQKQVELKYRDGRVATISFSENIEKDYAMDLEFKDTTCKNELDNIKNCKMVTSIGLYTFLPIWTTHSEKKKIGKFPQPKSESMTTPITYVNWAMNFWKNRNKKNILFANDILKLNADKITCDNLNWLPYGTSEVADLSFEAFQKSSETGLLQNKVIRAFKNAQFELRENTLIFKAIKPFYVSNIYKSDEGIAPAAAETIGFSFAKNDNSGEVCHMTAIRNTSRNLLQGKLSSKMSDFKPIVFNNIKEAVAQLVEFQNDELTAQDPEIGKLAKQLPPVVQILDVFGLARINYQRKFDGQVKAIVNVKEVE